MTDRARVASLPNETRVADLPLRQRTSGALRAAGVPTLGDLRAMPDHELLRIRPFSHGALADVRSLVPVPGGKDT